MPINHKKLVKKIQEEQAKARERQRKSRELERKRLSAALTKQKAELERLKTIRAEKEELARLRRETAEIKRLHRPRLEKAKRATKVGAKELGRRVYEYYTTPEPPKKKVTPKKKRKTYQTKTGRRYVKVRRSDGSIGRRYID